MTVALEMFAIAPARGSPSLTEAQQALLIGKALWLHRAAAAGLPVVPTVCLTRAAWEALQAERDERGHRLRSHWVATLLRLVGRDGRPPTLVVRTSRGRHTRGLQPAIGGIQPPAEPAQAVDSTQPLGAAIERAFASYEIEPYVPADDEQGYRDRQIVIVQAEADGALRHLLTRDPATGRMGPVAPRGDAGAPYAAGAEAVVRGLDALAGQHLRVLVEERDAGVRFLSARPIEASPEALLEAAVDRVRLGTWSEHTAVGRIDPATLTRMLHPNLGDVQATPLATGLGVSPGAASGIVVFTPEDAARARARGRHCILVVAETGPGDIEGMRAATGILTARGGMTSHAAVVARITGKPCVAALRSLTVNAGEMRCSIGPHTLRAGDLLTIDGSDGNVYAGALPLELPDLGSSLQTLLGWSDGSRSVAVRANAETVEAAETALGFGAEGIGLARSEHMFFSPERMVALRRLILSEDERSRANALHGLVDYQVLDYAALFNCMRGKPVTVRLFDPPLHEFLPRSDEDIEETAASLGIGSRSLKLRLERLSEVNPMLGHRGVRLAITYPEILEMQIAALVGGVRVASSRQAEPVALEVMVPFVSSAREVAWVRERVTAQLEATRLPPEARRGFAFGTMIELPRAVLRAAEIAPGVDFFSFGTNDLTQTALGISRDDSPAFLAAYQRKGVFTADPFVTIDREGVGEFIAMAIARGRSANPGLKIGICGEHAGDVESLRFFSGLGVDYVSCSPYRVPVARLTLAQAGADAGARAPERRIPAAP